MSQYAQNKIIVFTGALLLTGALPASASVRGMVSQGNRSFKAGDYDASAKNYAAALEKDPESDIINFNMGTALYKQKEYQQAIDHLHKTLLTEDPALKEKAHYNLGNSLYKAGIAREDKDINAAIAALQEALKQYEGAMTIDAKDEDARYNHDFVQKELERLRKKQKQQQQQQSQKKKEKSKEEKSQQNQSQGGQGQAQSQQQKQQQSQQGQQEKPQGGSQQKQDQEKAAASEQQKDKGEEQSGQKGKEDQQQQQQGQASTGEEGQQQQGAQQQKQAQGTSGEQLTPAEAQMILQSYQQGEEPKGLLNVFQKPVKSTPVSKDW